MITVIATQTVKGYHPNAQWSRYPDTVLFTVQDMKEVSVKLQEIYGRAWTRKRPMYIETDRGTKKAGWVVGFRVDKGPGKRYLQQDWVSLVDEEVLTW